MILLSICPWIGGMLHSHYNTITGKSNKNCSCLNDNDNLKKKIKKINKKGLSKRILGIAVMLYYTLLFFQGKTWFVCTEIISEYLLLLKKPMHT